MTVRPLRAGRGRAVAVQPDPDALVALGVACDGDGEARPFTRHDRRRALQREQRGTREEQEGHHGRDGVAGQPEHQRVPRRVPNQVGFPGRRATRQKTSVTPASPSAALTWSWAPTETPPVRSSTSAPASASSTAARVAAAVSITCVRETTTPPARVTYPASGERVGVVDAAGGQRLADGDELVACREERDAGTARAGQGRGPGGGGDPERGGAEHGAGDDRDGPCAQVLAGASDVVARAHRGVDGHQVVTHGGRAFDHHHGIGTVRHRRAGRDPDGLAVGEGRGRRTSRARLADDRELTSGRARGHGVPVHRAVAKRRDVVQGDDVAGDHAAQCFGDRHVFDPERMHGGEDSVAGFIDGQQVGHGRNHHASDRSER